MAEALAAIGVAAAIIQLVDYGSKVSRRLDKFLSKPSRAPKLLRGIQIQLKVLLDALKHTQDALETGAVLEEHRGALHDAVDECRVQLEVLDDIVSKTLPALGDSWGKRGRKAIASLCVDSKVKDIRDELGRCIQALTYYHAASTTIQLETSSLQGNMVSIIETLVRQTQHAFLSTDHMFQQHFAQIYQRLSHQHTLLRALDPSSNTCNRIMTCPNCGKSLSNECRNSHMTTTDIFFDCASRFSREASPASIHRLRSDFSGRPSYEFERQNSFNPQGYVVERSDPWSVVAMKQQDHFTHQYYLLYAQSPRSWQRVIVSASFKNFKDVSKIPQVANPDNIDLIHKQLPHGVTTALTAVLTQIRLFSSVTKLSLSLVEDGTGRIVEESEDVETAEDYLEATMSDESTFNVLHDIEVIGCQKFTESQVEVVSRYSSSYFAVELNGQRFVERKISFATAGADSENGLRAFINDLKLSHYLRDCAGVSKLIGVVFDNTRGLHLKGCLFEAPMLFLLNTAILIADSKSYTMPWSVRVLWSAQIAEALADIHRKGFAVGVLTRQNIGIRTDGSIMLHRLGTSMRYLLHDKDQKPPELQTTSADVGLQPFNDRTDVFQLGLLLWLLAEQQTNTATSRCRRYVCTHFPRYQCTADHNNLTELPPCLPGLVPEYFSDIIKQCRSPDPRARPRAQVIADMMWSRTDIKTCPHDVLELLKKNQDFDRIVVSSVHCDNCGESATDLHYHCNVCYFGNFDLCEGCVAKGVHCFVTKHSLVKRKRYTDASGRCFPLAEEGD